MELSALVKEYNLSLTRAESNLVSKLPTGTSEFSSDQYEQRIKSLAAARDLLKQLPDRQTLERRSRMEKAAMLKERLKILRQMVAFLTPSAAKSLKSEMKQIASQIASLGAGSAGAGGGSAIVAMNVPAAEISESAQEAEKSQDSVSSSETDQGENGNRQEQQASSGAVMTWKEAKSGDPNAEDRQLKEMVTELKSLHKAVLEAVKRKQHAGQGHSQLPGASSLRVYAVLPERGGTVAFNA